MSTFEFSLQIASIHTIDFKLKKKSKIVAKYAWGKIFLGRFQKNTNKTAGKISAI